MEWHIAHTVAACFFGFLGFFMDMQSFLGGIRVLRKGKGPRGILLWPFALYVLAAFTSDAALNLKLIAIAIGLAFHLLSTIGMRFIGRMRAR